MPMNSSSNLGTEQENKTEISMSSRMPKANDARKAELTTSEKVVADSLENPTPEAIAEVIDEADLTDEVLIEKAEAAAATVTTEELATFAELVADGRERIDAIDEQILELVARRIEVAGELLTAKHTRGIDTRDKPRQSAIYDRLVAIAADFTDRGVHLSKHQIRELFATLIRLGMDNHRQNIINKRR